MLGQNCNGLNVAKKEVSSRPVFAFEHFVEDADLPNTAYVTNMSSAVAEMAAQLHKSNGEKRGRLVFGVNSR